MRGRTKIISLFIGACLWSCSPSEEELVKQGRSLMFESEYDQAIEILNKALKKNPENYVALNAKGVALLRLGKLEESIGAFTLAIAVDSLDYRAFFNRGNAKKTLVDDAGAIADYEKAIDIQPDVVDVHLNKGTILFKYGEFERALFDFEFALRLDDTNSLIYLNKGKTELRTNNLEDAIYDLKKAIEYKSDYGEAYYWLGLTEIARDRSEEGCGLLKEAAQLNYELAKVALSQNCN